MNITQKADYILELTPTGIKITHSGDEYVWMLLNDEDREKLIAELEKQVAE